MNPEQPKEKKLEKQTAADKYKALLEEANKFKDAAETELKNSVEDQIKQLNSLGFNYRLVEGNEPSRKSEKKPREKSDKPCGICNFKTNPPHDARLKAHRDQGEHKKPLNNKQLEEAGLTKV